MIGFHRKRRKNEFICSVIFPGSIGALNESVRFYKSSSARSGKRFTIYSCVRALEIAHHHKTTMPQLIRDSFQFISNTEQQNIN